MPGNIFAKQPPPRSLYTTVAARADGITVHEDGLGSLR
jgi:hypothetical protein